MTAMDARPATATLALHYTLYSTLLTVKQFGFGIFSIALPVVLYVIFTQLGAAMGGGGQLALERRSGWFRQLNITALPSPIFLLAKSAVIMVVVLPALILVLVAGFVVGKQGLGLRVPLAPP